LCERFEQGVHDAVAETQQMAGSKVEEKRENLSLGKLSKPGEREKEKYSAVFFGNFPYKKGDNISLRKVGKPGEREKGKVVLLFSSTLAGRGCISRHSG